MALRCSNSASSVTSRPISEQRISRVPLRMPPEVVDRELGLDQARA